MEVTNTSKALQGIHTLAGVAYVAPGETKSLELNDEQVRAARLLPFFQFEGEASEGEPVSSALEAIQIPENEVDQLRNQLESSAAEIAKLREVLSGQQFENERLTKLVDERDGEIAKLKAAPAKDADPVVPVGPFEVKDEGRGWFAVYGADGKQIGSKMREDDAKAFKALTPEEQVVMLTPSDK